MTRHGSGRSASYRRRSATDCLKAARSNRRRAGQSAGRGAERLSIQSTSVCTGRLAEVHVSPEIFGQTLRMSVKVGLIDACDREYLHGEHPTLTPTLFEAAP